MHTFEIQHDQRDISSNGVVSATIPSATTCVALPIAEIRIPKPVLALCFAE